MSLAKEDRCFRKIYFFIFCVLVCQCDGLNCRSGNENKELELQKIFKICQSRHLGGNDNRTVQKEHGSEEWFGVPNYRRTTSYKYNQNENTYDSGRKMARPEYGREDPWSDDKNMNEMRSQNEKFDRQRDQFYNERSGSVEDDANSRPDNSYLGKPGDKSSYGFWKDYKVNEKDDNVGVEIADGRGGLDLGDEGSKLYSRENEMIQTRSLKDPQANRRFKRSRPEKNSGSRSQYNPNTKRPPFYEDDGARKKSLRHSTSTKNADKACALHCYLENLAMTAPDGSPDKYLVTHVLTKDVTGEDLKDFLVESIEECFQILENEQTEERDKCEFSKNLLMCLSEKGKANCDDWREDSNFKVASHRINTMMT